MEIDLLNLTDYLLRGIIVIGVCTIIGFAIRHFIFSIWKDLDKYDN